MRKLLKYLKGYERESIIGPLFKMLEASFELIVPIIMANIIDIGIYNNDKSYILRSAIILVALGALGLICSLTAQYFAAKAALGLGTALRQDMFVHINQLSYAELDKLGMSTLVTRMTSDINQVQAGVNMVLRLFLRAPFIVIGAFVMAFTINVKITMIFLVIIPILSFIIYGIMIYTIPVYKKVQKLLDQVTGKTRENLVGVRVIRAFRQEKKQKDEFQESSDSLHQMQLFVGKISALLNPLTYIVVNLAIIAIIWSGGHEVNQGSITQGDVIALVNYMTQILLALLALSNLIISATKAFASAARVDEVLDTQTTLKDTDKRVIIREPFENLIEFHHVNFCYESSMEAAIEDITFSVKQGQTVGIIGGTGAGKSTLVNLIPRFYEATTGDILVAGKSVADYPLEQLRTMIGMVPQKAVLFQGSIRENMQWGKKDATDEEIIKALEIAQAKEFVFAKPEGLDALILQGGKNLSGGQRQRLTIARAFVGKPEIVILDDSASALDYATEAKLRKALETNISGTTLFIVSQRVASIKHCDTIIVLDDGKIAGIGSNDDLMENCEIYKEICISQN